MQVVITKTIMGNLITPPEIDKAVSDFCTSISKETPFYVDVETEDFARPSYCFPNVNEKIKREGGSLLVGWQIWTWPEKFIEAEFHGIWCSPSGKKVDITPKDNDSDKILFLPDKSKNYNGNQVNNIRHALTQNGLIKDFFLTFEAFFALQNYGERASQSGINATDEEIKILKWLLRWRAGLQRMIIDGLNKNSQCPCNQPESVRHPGFPVKIGGREKISAPQLLKFIHC